ncbi:MAG: universal stress protein [Gemmatimonadota bacterium]|nr:universal stress protein [Gemmatimonadota bacterium]MDH3424060.1 universal stress protein [Gemmatimonadota bacterium]
MLASVLVPLDGSEMGEWSLPLASKVARSTGARLHLAHVHVPYEPEQLLSNSSFQWEGVDLHDYDIRHVAREEEYLTRWENRLESQGAAVDATVLNGTPIADELVQYAKDVGADLIVMTSHGRSGVRRAFWGSVADEMIRKTALPVLVIHPDHREVAYQTPRTIDHVLVPLDGSTLAEAVLAPAADLAKATGARMTLTHVVADPAYLGPRVLGFRPDRLEPELDGAMAYLEPIAEGLRQDGLDVRVHVVRGAMPARTITEIADELKVDLVALATHGFGGVKRAMFGSVADQVMRRTELPLLVVRPPEAN